MAPREGFEPPRPMDSRFRIYRNTGLCDLGSVPPTCDSVISLTRHPVTMRIEVEHGDELLVVESDEPITIRDVLKQLEIPSSTVLAVFGDSIVPHTSEISDDIHLELVVVSSGG
jgi:sulfur carrier protein ThiS